MRVVIGVDPHKGSHTAVAIDAERTATRDRFRFVPVRVSSSSCSRGQPSSKSVCGRSSPRVGSAICSRSSSSVPASGCWMCRRRWRRGCGRCRRRSRKRRIGNDALSIAIAALRTRIVRAGAAGGSCGRAAVARETASGSGSGPEPQRVSAACVVDRARSGRYFQGNHGERSPGAPRPDRTGRPGRADPS